MAERRGRRTGLQTVERTKAMAHEIQAIVGSCESTAVISRCWRSARIRELGLGMCIVPLTRDVILEAVGLEFRFPDLEDEDEQAQIAERLRPLLEAMLRIGLPAPV